jgi:PAS domain S-box-containing protein
MQSATDYAIVTIGRNKKITDWNIGAELMFGYKKTEVVGRNFNIVYTKTDKKGELERVLDTSIEKNRSEHDREYVKKDGSLFWGSGIMMPIRSQHQELLGFLKIMRDNTKQKQIEEELRNAKEKAEQAASAKQDFLAHMSHEIRTPLNAVVGLSDIILEDPQSNLIENLNTLKFSAENLRMLINDILDFSKLAAGKFKLMEDDLLLDDFLENLKNVHSPLAADRGNDLKFYVDKNIPEVVRTDKLALSQILNNLINNAIKFTKDGEIKVHVHLMHKNKNQAEVNFSVHDTGRGISEDQLDKIFEAFTQTDKSVSNPVEGTGLGLTITKLLVEHLGGKIEVESDIGKGSCFSFTLSLKIGVKQASKKEKPSINLKKFKKLKILIVEDVETNRNILVQIFKRWGGLVPDEADNGKIALQKIKTNKYDVILLDVWMPGIDGYAVVRRVRNFKGEYYKNLPIIALTANSIDELKKHPESSLFTDIITKPFEQEELKEKIIFHCSKVDSEKTTGSAEKGNPHLPTSFSTGKLEDFLDGDREDMKDYLQCVFKNLQEFQEEFTSAIENQELQEIRDLRHKRIMMIDILGLEHLDDLLMECKTLFLNKMSPNQKAKIKKEVDKEFQKITASINEYIHTLKHA